MGNAGSRLKKMRKSFRRISLSKSKEKLNRSDQTRRSISLMNLSVLKRSFLHKKISKSSTTIAEPYEEEIRSMENKEIVISKNSLGLDGIEKNNSLSDPQKPDEQEEEKVSCADTVFKSSEEVTEMDIGNFKTNESESSHENHLLESRYASYSSPQNKSKKQTRNEEMEKAKPESEVIYGVKECNEIKALNKIDETLNNITRKIELMNYEDLLLNLPSLKDEIHFLWIKSYDVKETNEDVYPKKVKTIEYAKRVLHKLYSKAFKQHDYCTLGNKFADRDLR